MRVFSFREAKRHGFILSAGEFTSIDSPDSSNTWASAINDLSDIVGSYCDATAAPCPIISGIVANNRGYLLSEGKFTSIDFPGATVTQVWKISSGDDIVGFYEDAAGILHGFLLSGDEFSTIDFPGAVDTAALGINSDGDIVGIYCPVHCDPVRIIGHYGFVLRDGEFSTIDFPGAQFINPFSTTPCGDIAGGYRDFSGKNHGFLISKGEDEGKGQD